MGRYIIYMSLYSPYSYIPVPFIFIFSLIYHSQHSFPWWRASWKYLTFSHIFFMQTPFYNYNSWPNCFFFLSHDNLFILCVSWIYGYIVDFINCITYFSQFAVCIAEVWNYKNSHFKKYNSWRNFVFFLSCLLTIYLICALCMRLQAWYINLHISNTLRHKV